MKLDGRDVQNVQADFNWLAHSIEQPDCLVHVAVRFRQLASSCKSSTAGAVAIAGCAKVDSHRAVILADRMGGSPTQSAESIASAPLSNSNLCPRATFAQQQPLKKSL
jgi:hypothetical protein